MESLARCPRIAVILVNWRGADDTIECLETLLRCPVPLRVIVCDNDSGDGSVDKIAAWARGDRPAYAKSEALAHLSMPPVAKPVEFAVLPRKEVEQAQSCDARLTIVETGANLGFAEIGRAHV